MIQLIHLSFNYHTYNNLITQTNTFEHHINLNLFTLPTTLRAFHLGQSLIETVFGQRSNFRISECILTLYYGT